MLEFTVILAPAGVSARPPRPVLPSGGRLAPVREANWFEAVRRAMADAARHELPVAVFAGELAPWRRGPATVVVFDEPGHFSAAEILDETVADVDDLCRAAVARHDRRPALRAVVVLEGRHRALAAGPLIRRIAEGLAAPDPGGAAGRE